MEAIAYDERGLVPCVIQDARTGEVLTLAYMNAEALAKTEETGELHLWSRSRNELWRSGSYTAQLLADPAFAGEKVREEAEEVARAAREETDERVAEEAADVLYHLTVLLRTRGLELADAERVLLARRR
jgi:phosphoribosyl-ATP pyrophosphohydrolase